MTWPFAPTSRGVWTTRSRFWGNSLTGRSDLQPEYVCIWPYDQGGCGCDQCRPWGANGFLKCAENVAGLARKKLPGVRIILSTWMFDTNEWQGLKRAFSPKPDWVDVILTESAGFAREGITGMPTVGFPEISMEGMFPWGGFGANPQPQRFQAAWNAVKDKEAGGYPYSEGIFEDINKVIWAQLYWNSATPVADTLNEYIAYEYSPAVVDEVRKVIATLEQNHHFRSWPGEMAGAKLQHDWFPSLGVKPQADPGRGGGLCGGETRGRQDSRPGPATRGGGAFSICGHCWIAS